MKNNTIFSNIQLQNSKEALQMIIKIGNRLYDSEKEPMALFIDEREKRHITSMGYQTVYCSAPESLTETEVKDFMDITKDIKGMSFSDKLDSLYKLVDVLPRDNERIYLHNPLKLQDSSSEILKCTHYSFKDGLGYVCKVEKLKLIQLTYGEVGKCEHCETIHIRLYEEA